MLVLRMLCHGMPLGRQRRDQDQLSFDTASSMEKKRDGRTLQNRDEKSTATQYQTPGSMNIGLSLLKKQRNRLKDFDPDGNDCMAIMDGQPWIVS
jgi:hypothetical protein